MYIIFIYPFSICIICIPTILVYDYCILYVVLQSHNQVEIICQQMPLCSVTDHLLLLIIVCILACRWYIIFLIYWNGGGCYFINTLEMFSNHGCASKDVFLSCVYQITTSVYFVDYSYIITLICHNKYRK